MDIGARFNTASEWTKRASDKSALERTRRVRGDNHSYAIATISLTLLLSLGLLTATTAAGQGLTGFKLTDSQMSRLVQLENELQALGPSYRSADLGQRYRNALMLLDLAWLELINGELRAARQHADKALDLATSFGAFPIDGHLFHGCHLVLGHVALAAGDVELAKAHLIVAGQPPHSGTLSSFGPNMSLARALLRKGEFTTVLRYLELCEQFWAETERLRTWREAARNGTMPHFGANLDYGIPYR